jgi:NAD-dependent deacetylase
MAEKILSQQIEGIAELIANSKRIVVFTGAGVSTESGIPDFRSRDGIWTKYDPDDFTYQKFLSSAEARKRHWHLFSEGGLMRADAQPNAAHYAIAELERLGKLDCVITQNVDGLHQKAGNSREKVIQLHGNMSQARCLSCGKTYSMEEVQGWLRQGMEVPECPECHGILKPDVVFFGEAMPVWETAEAEHRSRNCDLCIVVGSSLVVYPAAFMPAYALQSGAKLVIINEETTQMDGRAHICIHRKAGEVLSQVIGRVKEKLS